MLTGKGKYILTALFFAVSFWFWGVLAFGTLWFLETTQFFPYTGSHLAAALCYPGGISEYVSEFFVQFFHLRLCAALLVSLAFCLLQVLMWKVMVSINGKNDALFPLSFVVAFGAWAFMCELGSMFTCVIALIVTMGTYLVYTNHVKRRQWLILPMVALLYYGAGPVSLLFPLLMLFKALAGKDLHLAVMAFAGGLLWATLPAVWSMFVQYTPKELYMGIDYLSTPEEYSLTFYVLMASTAVIAFLSMLPRIHGNIVASVIFGCLSVLVFAGGWTFVVRNCNPNLERIYEYDRLCCSRDWCGILDKAESRPPVSLAEISAVNLAMAKKGVLLSEMFRFLQPGPEALFPDYALGYVVALTAGESVYHSGLLNTARHYAFEEYESYPNYNQSARHMKRLAEIDLINGNHEVARRYLKNLDKTLFYHHWAKTFLKDPEAVASDVEYSALMQCRDTSRYLYNDSSDDDKRLMLRRLVEKNRGSYDVPSEYLIVYDLLAKDLRSLAEDLGRVRFKNGIPAHVQEAVCLLSKFESDCDPAVLKLAGQETKEAFDCYQRALIDSRSPKWLKDNFGKTYWYYFSSRK